MNTLLAAIALLAAQCCVLQCQSKKVINSRVEYMKYTVEQYRLGLISLSSIDGDRSEVGLVQNEFNANDTSPKDDTVVDTSSSVAGKRHVGPFDRTPLLSKVDDKQSRADDEENELSVDYKFNKTMGSYVIFHRTDDRAETDNVNESSSILTANSFDVTSSINAKHPSNSPTSKNSYCPTPYNPLKVDYVSGSLVEVNGFIFQCNDEPYTQYCNYPTFDETLFIELQADIEEATKLWLNAWVIIGECEKAVRPTLKPSTKPSREPSSSIIETPIYTPSWSPTTSPSWSPTATPTISTPNPSTKPSLSPLKAATSLPSISVTPTASPSVSPTANPSNSPTISPSYSPSTWSPTYYDDPVPDKCSKSQVRVRIELLTDGFPSDNSWVFKRKREKNGRRGALLMKSNEYEKVAQSDIREMCLDEGKYEFVLRDQYADGLCCEHGSGQYKISAMSGSTNYQWELIAAGAEFVTSEVRHIFTVRKSGQVNVECEHPQRKIRIEVKTDNFGEDTSWQFRDASGVVIARNERTYGKRDIDTRDLCLDDESMYEFTVFDTYGDGMCCQFGQGAYRILSYSDELFREEGIASSDGVAILHGGGGMFYNISHPINTTTPELNVRDQNWLLAHNIRRKKVSVSLNQLFTETYLAYNCVLISSITQNTKRSMCRFNGQMA